MTIYSCTAYANVKRAEGTKAGTRYSLKNYLTNFYPNLQREQLDEYGLQYLAAIQSGERDLFSDITAFLHCEWALSISPTHLRLVVNHVIDWMRWNDYELSPGQAARIKQLLPRRAVLTEDEVLTVPKIQTILIHSDVMMRAFILMMASSGMRANELLKSRFSDMREENGCKYLHIPAQRMKAKKAHDYRYSQEAADALKEYLKVKDSLDAHAENLRKKCLKQEIVYEKDRIFPFGYNTLAQKFRNTLSHAGMLRKDADSGRYTISFQAFRRWYDTTLKSHMPVNMANEIVGHDEGLSTNYRRYPRDAVDAAYLEVEPYLRIFTADDIRKNSTRVNSALEEQKQTTAALAAEVLKQRETIEALQLYIQATRKIEKKKRK